jgi:glyoxylase-like metal-dependent hydrolase (beta-lactamase superfamily II)
MRFAIGNVAVDVLVDDDFTLPLADFLPGLDVGALTAERGSLDPDFVDLERGVLICAIQTFVLRFGGRTILVDTCIGEHKCRPGIPAWDRRPGTGFLDRWRALGVAPESVSTVFCTHHHVDHVGWNTVAADGGWAPTFANARHLAGRRELVDWQARMAPPAPRRNCTCRGLRTASCPWSPPGAWV